MTTSMKWWVITTKRGIATASTQSAGHQHGTAAKSVPSPSKKHFCWIVALAVLFNFLLIIAVAAVLSHYQTKMATKLNEEIDEGFTRRSNISGPPGTAWFSLQVPCMV